MVKSNALSITLIIALITVVVGPLIVDFISSYVSTDSPRIFNERGCDSNFDSNNPKIAVYVRNRGNVEGYTSVCLNSQEVGFIVAGNKSHFCFPDTRVSTMSSELLSPFNIDLVFLEDELPDNVAIQINSSCYSKVFGIVPKPCKGFTVKCEYKKSGDWYRLI